jgi:hypothetical protein
MMARKKKKIIINKPKVLWEWFISLTTMSFVIGGLIMGFVNVFSFLMTRKAFLDFPMSLLFIFTLEIYFIFAYRNYIKDSLIAKR